MSRGKVKTPRPVYWGPEFVLAEMEAGKHISAIVADAAEDCDLSEGTLLRDVTAWRARSPDFKAAYVDAQVGLMKAHRVPQMMPKPGKKSTLTRELKERLLDRMSENGGEAEAACEELGINYGHVVMAINPEAVNFDSDFREAFMMAESPKVAQLRSAAWREATVPLTKEDARVNPLILRQLLNAKAPDMADTSRKLKVDGTVQHEHGFKPDTLRVIAAQQAALTPRAAISLSAPSEADVIDVEPEAERVSG